MDEQRKNSSRNLGMIFMAVNLISMGVNVVAAAATDRAKRQAAREADRIERAVSELEGKVDKISEQLRGIQAAPPTTPEVPKDNEKKPEPKGQQKADDVIYVKKSSEFWFYS